VPAQFAEAKGRYEQLVREIAALDSYFPDADFSSLEPDTLSSILDNLARDERTLRKLPRLHELGTAIRGAGLGELLDEMRARRLDPELAAAVLRYCWYMSILDRVGFDDRAVASFDGGLLGGAVETFRVADTAHVGQTAARVRRAAAERLTAVRDEYPTEGRLVEAQVARKTRHLPLRQLFAAAPHVMTALKPCWAMSPLVVSQLLPGDRPYFDVVVFDEASQIVPADAVPAILRGRRIIVAGDQHQLPPTSFFASVSAEDADPAPVVADDGTINLALTSGFESVLDVATAALGAGRVRSLTWHYRSHDERLIAFSNAWVYDRSLRTFPGVAGADCLTHVLVDGPPTTPLNTNKDGQGGEAGQEDSVTAEVDRVVELVIAHAAARPEESLGVITMGIKHAERIDAALRRALADRPALHAFFAEDRPEKFFVKNLERVQGDERDAIVLSIGYGKSADGKLPYRFGPLLQEGGQRRLNVAITRARGRMTVVSSFGYHDMDPARSTSDGVAMLRAYLRYAASGGTHLGDAALAKPELNAFEISVRDGLLAAGIPVTPHYGVAGHWIDFAAAHPTQPGRMVLAIEADGPSYHASPSVRDRDRLRQEQLERLGWRFHRIWSRDWFTDPEICVARARLAYEQAVSAVDKEAADKDDSSGTEESAPDDREALTPAGPPSGNGNGRGPRPSLRPGQPITEYSDRQLASVIRWIESDTLLRTEDELLAAFVSELGYRRRGPRIVEAFQRALTIARGSAVAADSRPTIAREESGGGE
jgi:very-short-patch-repair endonuclease